jgi:hypothetical protein
MARAIKIFEDKQSNISKDNMSIIKDILDKALVDIFFFKNYEVLS